ncbi:MAG TPA: TolC family protein [Gemmataceae bacterium]|nr:TolC family protein [Gemmataceae bacterium]
MRPTIRRRFLLIAAIALAGFLAAHAPTPVSGQNAAPPAPAPTVRRLTLEEARQLALAGNKSLTLARLNVIEKQHAADAARKDYLPKIMGVETYFHFDHDLGSVVTIQRGKLGLLPPGAAFVDATVLNQDTSLATVFVAQPITKLIAVNAAVQLARADEASAQAQLDKGTRDLLSGVTQAYQGLLGARRIQAALELQAKLLEQLLAAKPAPELRVALVEIKQGLAEVNGEVQELNDQLDSLLDLPACTVLELEDPLPPDPPVHCAEDAAQLAMAHDPEVRDAQQGLAKAQAAMKIAKMAYLPDVNVIGGFANQTGASYIQPDVGYIGITGSYTFWEWGKKRDVTRQRQATMALAQQNLQVTIDKVQLAARKAYSEFDQARQAYQLAGEMVEARKAVEKGAAGAAALQAKADTSKAELEYMKAEIAYRVADAKLMGLLEEPCAAH